MPHERDHKSRHIVAAILDEVWGILPEKLQQIVGFLEMRAAGVELSPDEIQAAIRMRPQPSFVEPSGAMGDDRRLVIDGVEILSLFGTMAPRANMMTEFSGGTSTQRLGQQFDQAMADPNVKAILLEVDSPGGMMLGTEELRQKIYAARGKKQVIAVGRGQVASAAYYVASAAEQLIATPSTQVGSIGVLMVTNDKTKFYENLGVKFQVWRAGEMKFAGNEYEALTEERAKSIQARVDGPYQMFLKAAAENRGVDVETVKATFGQGTVFLAGDALQRKMIDRVAAIEDVLAELRRAHGQSYSAAPSPRGDELPARVVVTVADPATTPTINPTKEVSKMNQRIKAALYAQGLTKDLNATDEICQAALGGYFRGTVPEGDDAILKGLMAAQQPAATAVAEQPPSNSPAPNVLAARDRELAEAKGAERARMKAIRDKAAILNKTGFAISDKMVEKAEEDGISPAEAVDRWTAAPPAGNEEKPIGKVQAAGSEVDAFHAAATDAFMLRAAENGQVRLPSDFKPAAGAKDLSRAHAMQIVKRDLQMAGVHFDPYGSDEDIAAKWLRMHGEFSIMGAEGGVTAANYPNLLGAFSNKVLDEKIRLQQSTYRRWCARQESVADFNPRLVLGQSDAGYLPEIAGDGEGTSEGSTSEEALAWFQVHRRAKKLKLTPHMVTQDQLGAFMDEFGKLQISQDRTIDMMAFDLLVSNPTLLDGGALFNTTAYTVGGTGHANVIDTGSGGIPSAAQAKKVRNNMRLQAGIGTTDPIEVEPALILVPIELEDDTKQTYLSTALLTEALTKATDTTLNVHRGSIKDIIPSGRLSSASAAVWYALADPMLYPVIKYVFQRGYENGKRETWWDPDTQCRYFRHETRVAVFVAGWRGAVKNMGA